MPQRRRKRSKESVKPRVPQRQQTTFFSWKKIGLILLGLLLWPALFKFLFKVKAPTVQQAPDLNKCRQSFDIQMYGSGVEADLTEADTFLISELHYEDEVAVLDCIESLTSEGDHLLLEYPANSDGAEIACDTLYPSYARFNQRLHCFGFDVPYNNDRRIFNEAAFRANFIAEHSEKLLRGAVTGDDVAANLKEFAEFIQKRPKPTAPGDKLDPNYLSRNINYLKQLARRLRGLSLIQIRQLFVDENNHYVREAEKYRLPARHGATDRALVKEIKSHQKQFGQQRGRVFVVAGADHLNPDINKGLATEVLGGDENVAQLTSKTYARGEVTR